MKYALTFTNPENYDWNETDTIIIDSPINPLDIEKRKLVKALTESKYNDYDENEWWDILANDSWFVRNFEDVDVDLWEGVDE